MPWLNHDSCMAASEGLQVPPCALAPPSPALTFLLPGQTGPAPAERGEVPLAGCPRPLPSPAHCPLVTGVSWPWQSRLCQPKLEDSAQQVPGWARCWGHALGVRPRACRASPGTCAPRRHPGKARARGPVPACPGVQEGPGAPCVRVPSGSALTTPAGSSPCPRAWRGPKIAAGWARAGTQRPCVTGRVRGSGLSVLARPPRL